MNIPLKNLTIKDRYEIVLGKVQKAASFSGRNANDVKLVVVTKGHPLESIYEVYEAGARRFGENYLEEAETKISACSSFSTIEWHMIGHLQSRKVKNFVNKFDWFHALDSLKLARKLSLHYELINQTLPVLLECNVSGEATKYGWDLNNEDTISKVIDEFYQLIELPGIVVKGLMCMAPYVQDPELVRPCFRKLFNFREKLRKQLPLLDWSELSMGMSSDFEVAIQEGATYIRLGTAILGPRP